MKATFRSAYIGGGGYIPGMIQNPEDPNILYARSDVGGVFKSENGGRSWNLCNNGFTKALDHYSQDLILDPKNPQVLFRAAGELRAHKKLGRIHRSLDGGSSWDLLTEEIDFFGNGPTRMSGHVMAIHPEDSNIIVAGGYSKGLWVSRDRGESWKYQGLGGKRITFVLFDPDNSNHLYIGTIEDKELLIVKGLSGEAQKQALFDYQDEPRAEKSELFLTTNLGETFEQVYQCEHAGFLEAVFVPNSDVVLIATSTGVLRSEHRGRDFEKIPHEILPQGGFYQAIAISPVDGTLYVAQKYSDIDCPIYTSQNLGVTWNLLSPEVHPSQMHEFPAHLSEPRHLGGIGSIACLMPDCKDADKLYFSNFWGVTVTYDRGLNFYGHHFAGLEMTCIEHVIKHPTQQNRVVLSIVDHAPMVSDDSGESYHAITLPFDVHNQPSRSVAVSRYDADFLIWSMGRVHRNRGLEVYRSCKGGSDAELVFHRGGQSFISCLYEDLHRKGRFWMINEGSLQDSLEDAGVFRSDDFGKSWQKITSPYPSYMERIPHKKEFVDQDFITVVPYQFRNGSGANKHLCGDYKKQDVLYVGEYSEGLYRSDDGGNSWIDISEGLPFHDDPVHLLSHVVADPDTEGTVYAGFWKAGLWRSTDFGDSWTQVYPKGEKEFNAVAISIDKGVIAVACAENTYSSVPADLIISFDGGLSWKSLYDDTLGSLTFNTISLDAKKRRIYAGACGNGVFTVDYEEMD